MSIVIEIKVIPSSGKQKCIIDKSGNLKCYLKSQPEKGKANKELIKYFSKRLKLSQNQIIILTGETSRKKRLKIECKLSFEQLCQKLELELQKSLT